MLLGDQYELPVQRKEKMAPDASTAKRQKLVTELDGGHALAGTDPPTTSNPPRLTQVCGSLDESSSSNDDSASDISIVDGPDDDLSADSSELSPSPQLPPPTPTRPPSPPPPPLPLNLYDVPPDNDNEYDKHMAQLRYDAYNMAQLEFESDGDLALEYCESDSDN